ncbi:MAG: hypothetical protein WD468_04625 [Pirellulales bacterium]
MESQDKKAVRVKHEFPAGRIAVFANTATVQTNDAGEFTISFYQITPPLIMGEQEETRAALASIDEVSAVCVASVVVGKTRMATLISAMIEAFKKHDILFPPSANSEE